MTQAADIDMAQRLDKLTSIIERVDNHVQELRIETKTFQARAEEQIKATQQQISDLDKSLNKRIDTLEQRSNGQETRFWGLVAILATTLLGVIGKVVFFPIDKV